MRSGKRQEKGRERDDNTRPDVAVAASDQQGGGRDRTAAACRPQKKGHEKGNAVESDYVRHPKKAETAGRERGKPRPAPGSWGLLRRAEKTRKGRSRSLRNLVSSHRGQEASGISAHDLTPVVCPQADSEEGSHSRSLRNDRQAKREKHILALWKGLHTLGRSLSGDVIGSSGGFSSFWRAGENCLPFAFSAGFLVWLPNEDPRRLIRKCEHRVFLMAPAAQRCSNHARGSGEPSGKEPCWKTQQEGSFVGRAPGS